MEKKRKNISFRPRTINKNHLSFSFCFSSVMFVFLCCTVILSSACLDNGRSSHSFAKADGDFQECGERNNGEGVREEGGRMWWGRRILGGPGSAPPRCASKCGNCRPCRPVHVPVPPGTPVTAEYYPEAWRCKCGNKLYMP